MTVFALPRTGGVILVAVVALLKIDGEVYGSSHSEDLVDRECLRKSSFRC
jgi:hypothetical protein